MNTSGRANIEFLVKRMNSAFQRRDYPGVLHASASIFETLAKDIVDEPSVQEKSLGSFFDLYARESALPEAILLYIRDVFRLRNKTPLAGHGNVQAPEITREAAIVLSEMTKAIVQIEYTLQFGDEPSLGVAPHSQYLLSLPSGLRASLIRTLEGHTNWVWGVSFNPRGGSFITTSTDATVRKWEIATGREMGRFWNNEHGLFMTRITHNPDGRILASDCRPKGGNKRHLLLWNTAQGRILEMIAVNSPISNLKFSQSGQLLATSDEEGQIALWNVAAAEEIHKQRVESYVAFSSDLDFYATINHRKEIILIDLTSGHILKTMKGRTLSAANMVISPDDRFIAVADVAHTIEIWEIASERCVHTLNGHSAKVTCMAFSPTGNLLASGSEDSTTRLWDVLRGRELQVLEAPCAVQCLDFHPLGSLLATGTQTHGNRQAVVQLWVLA